jgi:hydroxypyruvate isomerase
MPPFKPTVAWWSFEQSGLTPEQLCNAAAEIGYAGMEFAPREHWPMVRGSGLHIVGDRGHNDITNGLNDPSQHDRIEREILANLELAGQWDIAMFVCFSGERKGLDDEAGAVNTAEGLRRVAKAAEVAGVLLVLELLNSKVNHPDYQCDHTAWGIKVVEAVDSPAVKLLYDIYHMQVMEGDIIRTIQDNHQHFGHYHIAGNPGRNDPDATQEINYPPVLRAIEATGYAGYLGMEYTPKGEPEDSLRAAYDLLKSK